uniref:Uncharacterized protein n=1 Tax=Rhizophora mucronata TaxID=61149 RepID=A0A2P2JG34_RHIMU
MVQNYNLLCFKVSAVVDAREALSNCLLICLVENFKCICFHP